MRLVAEQVHMRAQAAALRGARRKQLGEVLAEQLAADARQRRHQLVAPAGAGALAPCVALVHVPDGAHNACATAVCAQILLRPCRRKSPMLYPSNQAYISHCTPKDTRAQERMGRQTTRAV